MNKIVKNRNDLIEKLFTMLDLKKECNNKCTVDVIENFRKITNNPDALLKYENTLDSDDYQTTKVNVARRIDDVIEDTMTSLRSLFQYDKETIRKFFKDLITEHEAYNYTKLHNIGEKNSLVEVLDGDTRRLLDLKAPEFVKLCNYRGTATNVKEILLNLNLENFTHWGKYLNFSIEDLVVSKVNELDTVGVITPLVYTDKAHVANAIKLNTPHGDEFTNIKDIVVLMEGIDEGIENFKTCLPELINDWDFRPEVINSLFDNITDFIKRYDAGEIDYELLTFKCRQFTALITNYGFVTSNAIKGIEVYQYALKTLVAWEKNMHEGIVLIDRYHTPIKD